MLTQAKQLPQVMLKRQEVAQSFKARYNDRFIWIEQWCSKNTYFGKVTYTTASNQQITLFKTEGSFEEVRASLAKYLGVEILSEIEAYCFESERAKKIWHWITDDVFLATAVYERSTDTIRHQPSNICLISFNHHQPKIDVDPASKPYREIVERGLQEFFKEHNQRHSDVENKGWLAWLISEWIKLKFPNSKPQKLNSLIR